ncbi:hypothetical protein C8R43DRAFT_1007175 [Mycena crocata]|nr:hypothetical protein C8R43DRAFT_1007175 [Mycena crocata]
MASVASLRIRIEEISSNITRHEQALKDLENTRSELQRQLNAIVDPITRLPVELTSEIFLCCISQSKLFEPHPDALPMVLSNVSHSWREIALAIPSLWSAIRVDFGRDVDFPKLLPLWITRSSTRPLSLMLSGPLDLDVRDLVREDAHRFRNMELYLSPQDLRHMETPFPFLKSIRIGLVVSDDETASLDVPACVAMICAAPSLDECTIDRYSEEVDDHHVRKGTHLTLKHLTIGTVRGDGLHTDTQDGSTNILQGLTLPALLTLSIPSSELYPQDLLDFLTRSSPPLQTLSMPVSQLTWTLEVVERLCALMPTVVGLIIDFSPAGRSVSLDTFPILGVLADSAVLLPNLRTLTLNGVGMHQSHYDSLLHWLSARRSLGTQLQTFRLVTRSAASQLPTMAELRELAADGIDIHIGPEDSNHV